MQKTNPNANGRTETAKKPLETRKRNRYEATLGEKTQSARREYLYNKLTDDQREAIEERLDSSTYPFDPEREGFVLNGNLSTDIERQEALATCHHEASHAVVAWRVGEMAAFLQLGEVHGGEGDFAGMCCIPPIYDFDVVAIKTGLLRGKKEELVPKLSYKSALIHYAGRAGHNKYLSDLVGHKVCADRCHFVSDMRLVREVTTDRKLMAKYCKQAEQMVERDWKMIQKLAFALFERKRLKRREIEGLLGISIGSGGQTAYEFRGFAPAAAEEGSVLV